MTLFCFFTSTKPQIHIDFWDSCYYSISRLARLLCTTDLHTLACRAVTPWQP